MLFQGLRCRILADMRHDEDVEEDGHNYFHLRVRCSYTKRSPPDYCVPLHLAFFLKWILKARHLRQCPGHELLAL